jgi:hypothetical protein
VLHGKETAKKKQNDKSLPGNRIDRALRNCNDRQTVGIPIGPDTSLAIAELILSEVDVLLKKQYPKLSALRYIDDYEIATWSRSEAEDLLGALTKDMAAVELALNDNKTAIRELPLPFEHPWTSELRELPLRKTGTAQANDLIRSFERAMEHARRDRNEPVFRYLLGRYARADIIEKNWPLYQDLLLQSMIIEPGAIISALRHLIAYTHQGFDIHRDSFEPAFNRLLLEHCQFTRVNEIAWLLWGMMILKFRLFASTVDALAQVADPFVVLLALHAEIEGLCDSPVDKSHWSTLMTEEELFRENWIVAYEALQRQWLPSFNGKDYVAEDERFAAFAEAGVRFYNTNAISGATPSGVPPSLGVAPLFYTD